jgi:hypothetical protein
MPVMKTVRAPAPDPWEQLPTDLRLVLAWLGLVKTDLRTGKCSIHPSAPERLRRMAREIEAAYPEVEAVSVDEPGPLETSAKRVNLSVFRTAEPGPGRPKGRFMSGSNASRILEFVNANPGATLREIQVATNLSPSAISNMLIRSVQHGHLKRHSSVCGSRRVWRYSVNKQHLTSSIQS